MRRILILLCLLAAFTTPAMADSPPLRPTFGCDSASVEATPELQWSIRFGVYNPFDTGLYLDSLTCDVAPLEGAASSVPLPARLGLTHILKVAPSIGATDGVIFDYAGPALAERARLTFTLKAHRMNKDAYVLTSVVETRPGAYSRAHPSELIRVNGRRVELLALEARETAVARPGVLMVHDAGGSARSMLYAGYLLTMRGYNIMLFSMPGYGDSEGPADFMGGATQAAADSAFARLKGWDRVDSARLAVFGVGRGATVAADLAARQPGITALIAQSGFYDPWAVYRNTTDQMLRQAMVAEAGTDSAAWRRRAPVLTADRMKAQVLMFHGERDAVAPIGQARGYAATLVGRGASVETRWIPAGGHTLNRNDTSRFVFEYLKRVLRN